jgi:hypothetical protein
MDMKRETCIFPAQYRATLAAGNISDCVFPGCHLAVDRVAFNHIDAK